MALVSLNLLLWLTGEVLVTLSPTDRLAVVLIRVTYAVIGCIPLTVHRFLAILDDPGAGRHRIAAAVTAAFALSSALLLSSPLIIAGARQDAWGYHHISGPLFSIFSTLLFGLLGADVVLASLASCRLPNPMQRLRCQYVLLGVGASVTVGLLDMAVLQPLGVQRYHMFVVPFGVTIGCAAMIYSIARTRLVDVPTAVRRVAVNTALLATLLVPCLGISLLVEQLSTGHIALLPSFVTAALFCVAGFGFPRLRLAAEQTLAQILFGARADDRRLLVDVSREITSVLSLPTLAAATRSALTGAFGDVNATLWLRRPTQLAAVADGDRAPIGEAAVLTWLESATQPVVLSEIESTDARPLAPPLRERGIELAVPLRVKRRAVGLLTLARRPDQRLYTNDDISLVVTLANQVGIALENARLYEELRESREQVTRASRLSSIGLLAAGLAHEIRNPLVAVKTFLDLLPQRLDDREFLTNFRELSQSELRRVMNLLTDLLTLGKSTTVEYRSLELVPTLEPVLRLMESTARKHGVTLVVRAGGALPPVWADADRLKQILLNLVLNAIDASPQGSEVTVEMRSVRQGVLIEVTDRGPGIPADHLENIFNPFFTTKETGTGLGLALVHQMVVEHGGQISVDSTPGRGSVFRVTLPAAPAALERTGT
jgi:two-component system NtrC family sensor kinase